MSDETETQSATAVLAAVLAGREQFLGFLERRMGGREAAEEILQAAYLKALERGATVEQEQSAVAWFYRLLRNAMIDHRRRRVIEERAIEQHRQEVQHETEIEDEPLHAAVCGCVKAIIPTLKPE